MNNNYYQYIFQLQIWDTAGQERFRSVTQSYYHNADGVIIVYDITSSKSFESIPKWLEDVNRFSSKNVLMAVVGNKCDLDAQRQVDLSVAKLYAETENCVSLETSAKESDNVELLFMSMATELKRNVKSAADSAGKETVDAKPANGITIGGHAIYSRGPVACCRL